VTGLADVECRIAHVGGWHNSAALVGDEEGVGPSLEATKQLSLWAHHGSAAGRLPAGPVAANSWRLTANPGTLQILAQDSLFDIPLRDDPDGPSRITTLVRFDAARFPRPTH
jgi:hypothetical protein